MCVVITLIKYLNVVAIISPKQQQNSIIIPMPAKKKTTTTRFPCREINNEKVIFFQK